MKSFPCTGSISTYMWEKSHFCCTRLQFIAFLCLSLIVDTDGSASCGDVLWADADWLKREAHLK